MVLEQSKSLVLGNLLQRLNENLRKEAQLFYKSQNIDFEPKWFPVVYVLSQKKAISVVELSQEIGYSHPTTISLLKELEKKELIGSTKDAKDERKRLITLTDKANEMIDQLQPLWQIMTEALIELTDTENNLFKAIHEVTQNLKTKNLFDRMTTIKEMKSESAQKSTGNTVKVEKIDDSKLIEIAFAIRRQVFVEEQNVSQERESMDDEEAVHYLATVNGLPAGAALAGRPAFFFDSALASTTSSSSSAVLRAGDLAAGFTGILAVTEGFLGASGAAGPALALVAVFVLDWTGVLDFFAGMRTSKKMAETGPAELTKIAKRSPRAATPVVFVVHYAHLSPERAGLQAVWANIWCAVLAGFRQDRGGSLRWPGGFPCRPCLGAGLCRRCCCRACGAKP